MATKSAIVHNPAVRPLYRRLRAKGKRGDVSLGHCARKLLHLVFAIWKSNRPFDPNHYPWDGDEAPTTADELQRSVDPKQEQVQANPEDANLTIHDEVSHDLETPERPRGSGTEPVRSGNSCVEMSLEDLPSSEPVVGRSPMLAIGER